MEALNSAAQTASKYLFGNKPDQSRTEPMSGAVDNGVAEEPHNSSNKGEDMSDNNPTTNGDTAQNLENSNHRTNGPIENSTKPSPSSVNNPVPPTVPKGRSEVPGGSTTDELCESATPTSGQLPGQEQPGHDRQFDNQAEPQRPSVSDEKNKAEETTVNQDQSDHSGEPMSVHDGGDKEKKTEPSDAKGQSEENGTGEKWVKSTGLAADGGDFDATQPGAGREADRLLEEKGIHKDGSGMSPPPPDTSQGAAKEKHSIAQKLKDKLHIGHNKHT